MVLPSTTCPAIPIGSIVVPFGDYLIGFQNMNHKKKLLCARQYKRSENLCRTVFGINYVGHPIDRCISAKLSFRYRAGMQNRKVLNAKIGVIGIHQVP